MKIKRGKVKVKGKVTRRRKHPTQKTGMPPGNLMFTGKQKMEKIEIKLIAYNESEIEEFSFDDIDLALKKMEELNQLLWLNIIGIHNSELIQKIIIMGGNILLFMNAVLPYTIIKKGLLK